MKGRELRGGVVVLVGASSGIGRAAARAFAAEGASLVLAARREDGLRAVAAECEALGARTLVVPTDVTEAAALRRLVAEALHRFGRIDVWVNNAAVGAVGRFLDVPMEAHERVLRTNLLGHLHGAHAVLPVFERQGRGVMINTLSLSSFVPAPYVASYGTSKFALRGFHETLRSEMSGTPAIRICDVYPGFVDTPGIQNAANYTGRRPTLPPPVQSPETVARAMVRLARRPRNRLSLGLGAAYSRAFYFLLPGATRTGGLRFVARYFARAAPAPVTDGNLFAGGAAGGVRGDWLGPGRGGAALARKAAPWAALAAALLLGGAALARRSGRRGVPRNPR